MKQRKAIYLLIAALLGVAGAAFAQGSEKEHYEKMKEYNAQVKDATKALVNEKGLQLSQQQERAKEAQHALFKAKEQYAKLKVVHKGKHALEYKSIETHYATGEEVTKKLTEELNKPKPSEKKVKEYANILFDSVEKVEKIGSFIF